MSDLRIGVVGLGARGEMAEYAHRPGKGAVVVACADPDPHARKRAAAMFGSSVVTVQEHHDLVPLGLDAVVILTPDHLHAQQAIDFLESGVAVFVEKPLAINTEDADRVLSVGLRTGTRLYVGHNLRHAAPLLAIRKLIQDGAVGEVKAIWCRHFVGYGGEYYFRDWHAERRFTNSLLLQKGAHDLDVLHWLADGFTRHVVALGDLLVYEPRLSPPHREPDRSEADMWPPASVPGLNPRRDVEDISMMLGRLNNGVMISYEQCHFTPDYWRNYTVIGDSGRLENFGDLDGALIKVWNKARSGYREDADHVIQVDPGEGSHGGADEALMSEFLHFAEHGGATETSPVAAREAVAAGSAAALSLREGGRPVEVPPPNDTVMKYFASAQTQRLQ